jgi:hypothetical protein
VSERVCHRLDHIQLSDFAHSDPPRARLQWPAALRLLMRDLR